MAGTELDISARKHLEHELALALARSSGILAISADAIICLDESQRITMFNAGAEKLFGYSTAEMLGQPLDRLIPERLRAIHREQVAAFAAGGEAARRMGDGRAGIVGLRKSGEEFPADASISKLDVGGRTILTVSLRDVTEQTRREREERLLGDIASALAATLDYEKTLKNVARLVVRDLADICVVETLEEDGRASRPTVAHRDPAQSAAAAALGCAALDSPRAHLRSCVLDARQPLLVSEMSEQHVESMASDAEQRRALRELEIQSLLALPLLAGGQVLGTMLLVSTTPARRFGPGDLPLAEEVARRAASAVENARLYRKAVEATHARDELLGIVAHDLRNPLSTVLVETACIRRSSGPEWDTLESVAAIESSVRRMTRLIDDLLDLTRIEGGRLSVERAAVSVSRLVSDCMQSQKPLASAASLQLRLEIEPDLPDVWGDRDRLLQALENLLGNALKFAQRGGHITLGAARAAAEVRFWVSDDGAGIPAEHLPRVFDRFWQARTNGRHGAGLGLPIVKGIVEAHGGAVSVESTLGHGSTFFFTVPMVRAAEHREGHAQCSALASG